MEESLKLIFAELLSVERENRGLTKEDFAFNMKLTTPRTLHYILNTRVNLTLRDIAKYCAALGVRPNLTFTRVDTREEINLFTNKYDEKIK